MHLRTALQKDGFSIPQALLLTGGTFEEKKHYLFDLIARRLLKSKASLLSSEEALFAHPDVLVLPAVKTLDAENNAIYIDDIRSMIEHLTLSAHQGGCKIAVLLTADFMTLEAVNALLKTLEEPLPSRFLFLMADYPHRLPATLRSRCQTVRFSTHKKIPPCVDRLNVTLTSLKEHTLSVFEAADQWESEPVLGLLDALFYYFLEALKKKPDKKWFAFYDLIMVRKEQYLKKQRLNPRLLREHLFYTWEKMFYDAG